MTLTLLIVLFIFLGYSAFRAIRASNQVVTISDFFSFGPELKTSALGRAFLVTNTSFTTSFVALYLFAFTQGYFALITPISFFLGIVIYSYYFLPRQIDVLAHGHRYPELLEIATSSSFLRPFVAIFILFSLWMFTFAEVQGLNLFLAQLFSDIPILSEILPICLIIALAFYVSRNGYRATTANDGIQVILICLGAIAVFVLAAISAYKLGLENVATATYKLNPFNDTSDITMFTIETLFGFAFSQLLYYDNWQRLSFFAAQRIKDQYGLSDDAVFSKKIEDDLVRDMRAEYIRGGAAMLFIFSAPILLGIVSIGNGISIGNMSSLAEFFKTSWIDVTGGPILVILSFIYMLSALLSTAESYAIGSVNCLIEDVFKFSIKDMENNSVNLESNRRLEATRILTAVITLSLVPFLLIHPNFETLFIYLFYSINGFVGPLLFLTLGKQLQAWTVIASIIFGFLYPLPVFFKIYASYFPHPGLVPVLVSISIVGLFIKWNGE